MGAETSVTVWRVQIEGDVTCPEPEITRLVLRIRLLLKQAGIPKTESLTVWASLADHMDVKPGEMKVAGWGEAEHVNREWTTKKR